MVDLEEIPQHLQQVFKQVEQEILHQLVLHKEMLEVIVLVHLIFFIHYQEGVEVVQEEQDQLEL